MKMPEWMRPATYGVMVGAVAAMAIGFGVGGWVSGAEARKLADQQAQETLMAALVPICLDQAKNDPDNVIRIAELEKASSWVRDEVVADVGWATMPGAERPARGVANACAKRLIQEATN